MDTLPKELNIKNEKYTYDQCNPYQIVLYRQMALKVDELKKLKHEYEKTRDAKTMVLIHKGVGVLEFFQERFKTLGKLQHITNLYELEKARAID